MPRLNTPDKIAAFGALLSAFKTVYEVRNIITPAVGADLNEHPFKFSLVARDGSILTFTVSDTDLFIPEFDGAD